MLYVKDTYAFINYIDIGENYSDVGMSTSRKERDSVSSFMEMMRR